MNDPIDNITWIDAADLHANDYNPNVVVTQELRLLEFSILKTGWIQPILVDRDLNIIDGFHRWSLSRDSKKLQKRYGGKVPVAKLDISRAEAMMLTVRINRAKGTHVAFQMSKVVRELIDVHGVSPADVGKGIGAGRPEVDLLYQQDVFKVRNIKDAKYSKAWVPIEAEERPAETHEEEERGRAERRARRAKRARNPSMKKKTGSTRFNSPKYLEAWTAGKGYPKIHNAIAGMFDRYGLGESAVDLCGNTGLLATRVIEHYQTPCFVVEADTAAIDAGMEYGLPPEYVQMEVGPDTYGEFFQALRDRNVDTLIARRCISELFADAEDPNGAEFARRLLEVGVTKIFLQGRAPTSRATHPIPSVKEELALFLTHYKVAYEKKQLAYLVPK